VKRREKVPVPERRGEESADRTPDRGLRDGVDIRLALFASSFFGVYVHDFEGNFLDANDAALNLLGYEREELQALSIFSLLGEEEVRKASETLAEIRLTGRQRELTRYKVRTKDGGLVWVETEGFLLRRQGEPYAIQGIAIDITGRIRAEQEVRRYQEQLQELVEKRTSSLARVNEQLQVEIVERRKAEETLARSEERYRRLAENVRDMIWITDDQGKILYVNRAVEKICGILPEDALGLPNDHYLTQESIEKTAAWIIDAETADPRRDSYHGEIEVRHKSGHTIPCEVNATIVRDAAGRIVRYEGVTRDISGRKKAEEAMRRLNEGLERKVRERTDDLEKAYEELKRLDRLKDEFLSLVSHELRTPLTSIRSFSEILLSYEDEPQTRKEFLTIIKAESERLTRLINNLLDFSKIEAGAVTWHDDLVSVEAIVKDSVRTLQNLLREKSLHLDLGPFADLPSVTADRDRIQQVVTNLLSNAIKFSFEGGRIRIQAEGIEGRRFRESSTWIKVSVSDQGIGIDRENFEIIFHRFRQVTTETQRDKPSGTGLGLAICREIISHYGGNIWVESERGKGSTFCFTLPAAPRLR
jgi:PAS domain S-box-containing protein